MQKSENKIGVLLPYKDIADGVFESSYTTIEQVKTNLLNLLLTIKGERYMQPDFGTDLYKKIFEQDTEDLRDDINDEITRAIDTWLPYVIIKDIDIYYANEDDFKLGKMTISLLYGISVDDDFGDMLTFQINKIA